MRDFMRDFAVVQQHARELAHMSGIDLDIVRPRTRKLWEARALALHCLADGDMAEAHKVMSPFKARSMTRSREAGSA